MVKSKKTAVVGASPNPNRYSYLATEKLDSYGHQVLPLGARAGKIGSHEIITEWPVEKVDTITMYMGAPRQAEYIDYLLSLEPERIIFNPGAENPDFAKKAADKGIEVVNACTLVMLSVGNY